MIYDNYLKQFEFSSSQLGYRNRDEAGCLCAQPAFAERNGVEAIGNGHIHLVDGEVALGPDQNSEVGIGHIFGRL